MPRKHGERLLTKDGLAQLAGAKTLGVTGFLREIRDCTGVSINPAYVWNNCRSMGHMGAPMTALAVMTAQLWLNIPDDVIEQVFADQDAALAEAA